MTRTKKEEDAAPAAQTTALLVACRHRDLKAAKMLVETGADANGGKRAKETPLKAACSGFETKGTGKLVELLLSHGADPEYYAKGHDGPLHCAAMYGHKAAARALIRHGVKIDAKGEYGRTALLYAASAGRRGVAIVADLLAAGANIKATNEAGDNALFELITAEEGSPDAARLLLDHGLAIESKRRSHGTALHWAAFCGRTPIVKLLLERGARVNARADGGYPIQQALGEGQGGIVKLLLEHGADPETDGLLEFAAETGDHAFVTWIMGLCDQKRRGRGQKGQDQEKPKKRHSKGALAAAAKSGALAMIKLLVGSGVDPDECERYGSETPLMKAAYHGKLRAMQVLVKAGAAIQARDARGNSPLLHAAWSGHARAVAWLLNHGASVTETNDLNWTALMQACIEGHDKVAKLLLEHGCPTDVIDKQRGATALTLARHSHNRALEALLLAHGAQERKIRKRKDVEPYLPILACEICAYLLHKEDLGRMERPMPTETLELLHTHTSHPDRYADATEMVKKCPLCGTYYHHDHYIDTEDAFAMPPHIDQYLQRYTLTSIRAVLKRIKQRDELNALQARYPFIIAQFESALAEDAASIKPNILPYVIESLTDHYLFADQWPHLLATLLAHPLPAIALHAARDLILVFGGRPDTGDFPSYSEHRHFCPETQQRVKALLIAHKKAFRACIEPFEKHADESIRGQAKELLETAKRTHVF